VKVTSTEDEDFPPYPGLGVMQQYSRDGYWTPSPESDVNYYSGKKTEASSVSIFLVSTLDQDE